MDVNRGCAHGPLTQPVQWAGDVTRGVSAVSARDPQYMAQRESEIATDIFEAELDLLDELPEQEP